MVDFILATTDVDYGTIASEASFSSDFGTFKGNEWQTIGQENRDTLAVIPRESDYYSSTIGETNATINVIGGELSAGLRLDGATLVGTPSEVARDNTSPLVLRAL